MEEACGPAEDRYRLPKGTYRELTVKFRLTEFVKERFTARRELREDPRRYLPGDKAEAARLEHADEQARVKAADLADHEVAVAGRLWCRHGRYRTAPTGTPPRRAG